MTRLAIASSSRADSIAGFLLPWPRPTSLVASACSHTSCRDLLAAERRASMAATPRQTRQLAGMAIVVLSWASGRPIENFRKREGHLAPTLPLVEAVGILAPVCRLERDPPATSGDRFAFRCRQERLADPEAAPSCADDQLRDPALSGPKVESWTVLDVDEPDYISVEVRYEGRRVGTLKVALVDLLSLPLVRAAAHVGPAELGQQ